MDTLFPTIIVGEYFWRGVKESLIEHLFVFTLLGAWGILGSLLFGSSIGYRCISWLVFALFILYVTLDDGRAHKLERLSVIADVLIALIYSLLLFFPYFYLIDLLHHIDKPL